MRRRQILAFAAAVPALALLQPVMSRAAEPDPGAFMTDVSNQVLHLIQDRQTPDVARQQRFAQLVAADFDVPKIARFVLGQYWRTASDDERRQFARVFQTYLVRIYWSRFSQYDGQSLKITGSRTQSADLTVVSTQIVQPAGKPPVKVDWTLTKEGDAFKITDVSIEGVSQLITYRDEFASVLGNNNGQVGALIADLNNKIKS